MDRRRKLDIIACSRLHEDTPNYGEVGQDNPIPGGHYGRDRLWGILRVTTAAIFIFVIATIAEELSALKQVIYFYKASLHLTWKKPEGGPHHYRIEVTDTDQLAESTAARKVYYKYSKIHSITLPTEHGHSYSFRVQAVSETGYHSDYSDASKLFICDMEAKRAEAELARDPTLSQNYPNPFNSSTLIRYIVPFESGSSPMRTKLTIFNALGQNVRTLVDEEKSPGEYAVSWNTSDDSGNRIGSGVYFYRLEAGGRSMTKKMLYVK